MRVLLHIDVGQYSRMCCNNHTAVSCRCLDVIQENAIISALAGLFCRGYATRYSRPRTQSFASCFFPPCFFFSFYPSLTMICNARIF